MKPRIIEVLFDSETGITAFCTRCNTQIIDHDSFYCSHCGAQISDYACEKITIDRRSKKLTELNDKEFEVDKIESEWR